MARGFNLTGWLDGETPRRPAKATLAMLHARGFTHVRLPVTAERLMERFATRQDVARRVGELDLALRTLLGIGFAVSLDLHPGERLNRLHRSDPEAGFNAIESAWRLLARRHAGLSVDRLFLEVLNEPVIAPKIWNEQGPRLAAAIRREAPEHTIVYGPANFQHVDALAGLRPLDDLNVVYAVHFYEPMIFTHQGQTWSNDPLRDLHGVPFPAKLSHPAVARLVDTLLKDGRAEAAMLLRSELRAPWTEARVADRIGRAASWAMRQHRPVIVNEFGVLGWKAERADRARWIAAVRRAAEAHCLGWAHWEYADGFGFVRRIGDRDVPDETIMEALLHPDSFGRRSLQPKARSDY